jgi:ADP-ribose pyrophosphatase YjhB (NUDIX family)
MTWKPHVTVAAVIERQGRYLIVEEQTRYGLQFNQPAGHLEQGEDLITAVRREVAEETGWQFEPQFLLAVQIWRRDPGSPSFVRFCFSGEAHSHNPEQALDDGIIACHWLTRAEVAQRPLRSPLVLKTIDEFENGSRYPLTLLHAFLDFA